MGETGAGAVEERFARTSGHVTGVVAIVTAAAFALLGVVDGLHLPLVSAAVLGGLLAWAAVLKPRVLVTDRRLVLRGMVETTEIPLAAIEGVDVRQVLRVRVAGKDYVSPAIGRSGRDLRGGSGGLVQGGLQRLAPPPTATAPAYADVVEGRIRQLAQEDRARRGIEPYSDEVEALAGEVRRTPDWLEVGLLLTALVVLVVSLLV